MNTEENTTDSFQQAPDDNTEEKEQMPDGGSSQQTVTVEDGFVLVHGGSFTMGSPEDEPWRSADETQHTVTVSDFYISPYEVRQSEYAQIMGENPSNFSGDNLPVENVSWLDAIAFCNALGERENLTPLIPLTMELSHGTGARTAAGCPLRQNGNTPAAPER